MGLLAAFGQNQEAPQHKLAGHLPPIARANEQDKRGIFEESKDKIIAMFSDGLRFMDSLKPADKQKFRYISSDWTLDVDWRTYQEQWAIQTDGVKNQGNLCCQHSLIMMLRIDTDLIYIYIYIYIYIRGAFDKVPDFFLYRH